jgi:hypothetical protein
VQIAPIVFSGSIKQPNVPIFWPDYPTIYPMPTRLDSTEALPFEDCGNDFPPFFYYGMPVEYLPAYGTL